MGCGRGAHLAGQIGGIPISGDCHDEASQLPAPAVKSWPANFYNHMARRRRFANGAPSAGT
jgi:hypothetical protein